MFNVMKAQIYQLLRNRGTYIILTIALIFTFCVNFADISGKNETELVGSYVLANSGSTNIVIISVLLIAFTAMVCGGDMSDRTINYELLAGTKRSDVYFGRAIVSLAVNILFSAVFTLLPLLYFTLRYGWGHTMTVNDGLARITLTLLPMIRMTSFYIMLTFLLRNNFAMYAISYILSMVEMLVSAFISELFDTTATLYIFSMDCFDRIMVPKNAGLGFFDDEDIMVVKDVIESPLAYSIIISGIVGTAVFLLLGYAVFRKRDMN